MDRKLLYSRCIEHMRKLCKDINERSTGSEGNIQATEYFKNILELQGWNIILQKFDAYDWYDGGAELKTGNTSYMVNVSPYSLAFSGSAQLACASNISELERGDFREKILLLYGQITREQLMPKNFEFYKPIEHEKIISLLEKSRAKAIICATARNPALAGGVYPFPLIEDGDFNIPSVYMTEKEGAKLLLHTGNEITIISASKRIPSKAYNVIGKIGKEGFARIVITAHIDAKKGTPGAIDNATGVAVLMLLSELLRSYKGHYTLELVALNGEDYYSAPGQMKYIQQNQDNFEDILFNINIDGAGYKEGHTAFSSFDLPRELKHAVNKIINDHPCICEGSPWYHGDHSIFLQKNRPAVAVTSCWLLEHSETQDITHTPRDSLDIVNINRIVEIAIGIRDVLALIKL